MLVSLAEVLAVAGLAGLAILLLLRPYERLRRQAWRLPTTR
jgi:hypothetical protein